MASARIIIALSLFAALLITPSYSLECTSQKFTSGKNFTDCVDLPQLDAYLHYIYNVTNASLSIAFVAEPAEAKGWVAWAINPNSTGMVGAQTLLAYKSTGDSVVVKTYAITSYGPLKESKLSFDVWDLSGEANGEQLVIFASVKVPENAEEVNQVWQVGPAVTDVPRKHASKEENINSKGVLKLVGGGAASSPAPSVAGGSSNSSAPTASDDSSGTSIVRKLSMACCLGVVSLIASFIGF